MTVIVLLTRVFEFSLNLIFDLKILFKFHSFFSKFFKFDIF